MNVMIVDDDIVDSELMSRTLKKSDLDASIMTAETVDEGLNHSRSNIFDIILLDYHMPNRSGLEMIAELRKETRPNNTTIVMMSTSEDQEIAIDCIKAGAQDFLIKSEINVLRLKRAILHAQTRFELEKKLFASYGKMKKIAESDSLTGLANRYRFDDALKINILNNTRTDDRIAVLMIDLDNFKYVNDSFGHDSGDELLKQVVNRIHKCLRGNEIFARLGGDEFAISLINLKSTKHASIVAQRIIKALRNPFTISNVEINCTASIGISICPNNGVTSTDLLKNADIAMYRAKNLGRNQIRFFEESMQVQFYQRMLLENELTDAQHNNQFILFYQPILNPWDKTISGFEALIRWDFAGDIRMPDSFIPVAEDSKQIVPIGRWCIREAIRTIANWNQSTHQQYSMAINVSPIQLQDIDLVCFIEQCLNEFSVPAQQIEIEITESVLLKNTCVSKCVIESLHELGCRISLDDFGTGYSSLSHLQNFPIDTIKLDRSLMPVSRDSKSSRLIEGVVALAKILDLNIIAEGVETAEHLSLCKELDIFNIQGFYYSKPDSRQNVESKFLNIEA